MGKKIEKVTVDYHPDMCDLCGKKINDDEYYYIGTTRLNIWTNCCTDFDCYHWLEKKVKRKKPWLDPKK